MDVRANRPRDSEAWRSALARLRGISSGLRALIWPPVCAACGESIEPAGGDVCDACARALAAMVGESYCLGCGQDRPAELLVDHRCGRCRSDAPAFDAFIRVGPYAGPLRSLILQFKRRMTCDRLLAGWMTAAISRWNIQSVVDIWTPIPSPLVRRLQRGFQPTLLLAREIARRTDRPAESLLAMARHVPRFHYGMSQTQRHSAIAGAFKVASPDCVKGRVIGVVDDVMTTGATLFEARRMLRKAGAKGVVAVVLAKTGVDQRSERSEAASPI